jgi:hypothetical protein
MTTNSNSRQKPPIPAKSLPDDPDFQDALERLAFAFWTPDDVYIETGELALDLPDVPEVDALVERLARCWGIDASLIRKEVHELRANALPGGLECGLDDSDNGDDERVNLVSRTDGSAWKGGIDGNPQWPLGSYGWSETPVERLLRIDTDRALMAAWYGEAISILATHPRQADAVDEEMTIVPRVDNDRAVRLVALLFRSDEMVVLRDAIEHRKRLMEQRWPGLKLPREEHARLRALN